MFLFEVLFTVKKDLDVDIVNNEGSVVLGPLIIRIDFVILGNVQLRNQDLNYFLRICLEI